MFLQKRSAQRYYAYPRDLYRDLSTMEIYRNLVALEKYLSLGERSRRLSRSELNIMVNAWEGQRSIRKEKANGL